MTSRSPASRQADGPAANPDREPASPSPGGHPSSSPAPGRGHWIRDLVAIARQLRHGIPPAKYDRDYFLSDRCEGFHEFLDSAGLSYVKERLVQRVDPRPGERLLEIGCGRGEVLRACAAQGARAIGIDYAPDAVRLTHETCGERAAVLRGDATALPFGDGRFDKVLLGDVLEHLTHAQAESMLDEVHRVLDAGGALILHTSPNVFFMHLLLPWLIVALSIAGRRPLARALLRQYHASWEYHVREYSPGRLQRLFRTSPFATVDVSSDQDLLRAGRSEYTSSLASSRWVQSLAAALAQSPLRRILSNDLWVVARKATASLG